MSSQPQIKIPATYMRGGTSKGVFFKLDDLPEAAQTPGAVRDALLSRVIGSPDAYAKQIDGMGGATSSTSKVVILSKSSRQDHDINYLFGQVAIDKAFIDWSGNCGNLSSAVGAFAVTSGLIDAECIPDNGALKVRIWQENIGKTIVAYVPIINGQVQEIGDFELDGVAFPAAEIQLDFMSPADDSLFPTGNVIDTLDLSDEVSQFGQHFLKPLKATLINAGIPTVFIHAKDIGYTGTERQTDINSDSKALAMFETIRAYGALKMGLIHQLDDIVKYQHTPKVVFVAEPTDYIASNGKAVKCNDIDIVVRALSMGQLHHAMMGTAAVAIAAAAAIPETLVNLAAGGGVHQRICFGHPSGVLSVGAGVQQSSGQWCVDKVSMSRSARVLMEGRVYIPAEILLQE